MRRLLLLLFFPFFANAQFLESVPPNYFTAQEIAEHQQKLPALTAAARACIQRVFTEHYAFFNQWKVSKFYGDANPDYQTQEGLLRALRQYGAPDRLLGELRPMSCIGFTMMCLSEAFSSVGSSGTWQKIHRQLAINGDYYGTDLQVMLRQLGWKTYYWNPDPSQNQKWDLEDQVLVPLTPGSDWMPEWGGHAYLYSEVQRYGRYYGVPVDDKVSLVNFGSVQPAAVKRFPLYVGTAHAGYHVFLGFMGQSFEGHSLRKLNSVANMETGAFNPLAPGSSPVWTSVLKYRSGVIVAPPTEGLDEAY